MLISRGVNLLKCSKILKNIKVTNTATRNGGHAAWNYRSPPPPQPKYIYHLAEFTQGVMWWWILWHLYTQLDHITGEFDYPDPSKWSDEELGISSE
ncbi:NADH dehydrogenase [ubiquinone] 1 beta subcomplex subunit 2, mitochondrial-like [Photinus pyralis]|uniref:NADH dehydrogenase [ubiquinone] 1 beta subcomplex subunit 2, mitochondrial-like n=1 Tax=Photinus pyralis TaxID=7054 RepID=UPI001267719E|nr:NADH dehydrogenase [ubiquinone] 1 beta subcomplex subunit 2, mitochondrial-like [Photinus pyralis]